MKYTRIFAVLAASALLTGAAYAQTAVSGSQSLSQSGAIINQTSNAIQQAPNAVAPGLAAAGVETCTSSASSGISGPGFGISFGGTGVDEGCDARLDARTLVGVGLKGSAVMRLCERPKMAIAMAQSGEFICPQIRMPQTNIRQVATQRDTVPVFNARQVQALLEGKSMRTVLRMQ